MVGGGGVHWVFTYLNIFPLGWRGDAVRVLLQLVEPLVLVLLVLCVQLLVRAQVGPVVRLVHGRRAWKLTDAAL